MTTRQFFALVGFLFVAVWVGAGFGAALLCLVGAALFAAVSAIVEGELDLGELQDRLQRGGGGRVGGGPSAGRSAGSSAGPARTAGPRVR